MRALREIQSVIVPVSDAGIHHTVIHRELDERGMIDDDGAAARTLASRNRPLRETMVIGEVRSVPVVNLARRVDNGAVRQMGCRPGMHQQHGLLRFMARAGRKIKTGRSPATRKNGSIGDQPCARTPQQESAPGTGILLRPDNIGRREHHRALGCSVDDNTARIRDVHQGIQLNNCARPDGQGHTRGNGKIAREIDTRVFRPGCRSSENPGHRRPGRIGVDVDLPGCLHRAKLGIVVDYPAACSRWQEPRAMASQQPHRIRFKAGGGHVPVGSAFPALVVLRAQDHRNGQTRRIVPRRDDLQMRTGPFSGRGGRCG